MTFNHNYAGSTPADPIIIKISLFFYKTNLG